MLFFIIDPNLGTEGGGCDDGVCLWIAFGMPLFGCFLGRNVKRENCFLDFKLCYFCIV